MHWYKGKILKGHRTGRTIGYPTINLDQHILDDTNDEGVYACLVRYNNYIYMGSLYFGPRHVKGEKNRVLEIYIIDFAEEIYDATIEFKIVKFIRGTKNFESLDKLAEEIRRDIAKTKRILQEHQS